MKAALSGIRRRLDAVPLWAVGLLDLGIVAVWLADFRLPDPLPGVDELFIGGILAASAVYTWRRVFGPPSALAASKRRQLAELELLHDDVRKAAGAAGVSGEAERIGSLLDGIRKIETRIEQTEVVLATPQYSRAAAEAEVARLQAEVDRAEGVARADLAKALVEAQRHVMNIDSVRRLRDELGAAFERVYQIVRRIHSQVIALGISQGSREDLTRSVDELARTVDEYEREQQQQARAEKLVDEELEADRTRREEAARKKPTTH